LIEASQVDERLGYVGEVGKINPQPVLDLLEKGYIPVVSTIGYDASGHVYNINADTAAAAIAAALHAESLISMTDTIGLLRDPKDPTSLIRRIDLRGVEKLKAEGVISGGMIPKVDCCTRAIREGVRKVFIIDGRVSHALLIETLTDEGAGTMFRKEI
ncbi:MAG: acetylglutamate kinase, partial [Aristaeellaceae bacterium]